MPDRVGEVLSSHVSEPVGGFTEASIDGLVAAASAEPAEFRLLLQHPAREPEFRRRADESAVISAAYLQISQLVPDPIWARWVSQPAPAVAVEAVIASTDAGQPDPTIAADRVRRAIAGVISAVAAGRSR